MRILIVHNSYQEPGGEDQVFRTEGSLLEKQGHTVIRYTDHNDRLNELNALEAASTTVWSTRAYRDVTKLIRREQPHVMHVHNTFPLISPSVYHAATTLEIPVVQTLHNYRLLCPQSDFLRDGRICEDCLGRVVPWPGVVHACYRQSRVATAGAAAMLTLHRVLGTYRDKVAAYIALTDFARRKFIEGGIPAERIFVKPNFVYPDPGLGRGQGGYALFVGRLTSAKGVETLLAAWKEPGVLLPLRIVGSGPLNNLVAEFTQGCPNVVWLGRRSWEEVLNLMREAYVLVFPSEWYEGFPLVIAEAFAVGLPVVTSDLGGMSSIVEDQRTGVHFRPRDPSHLVERMQWIASHREDVAAMRANVRAEFEAKYTAEVNYAQLMRIYEQVLRKG